MPLTVIIAAAAISASLPILWLSLSAKRPARASAGDGAPAADLHQLALTQSATERVFRPAIAAISGRLRVLTPAGWVEGLERQITFAGLGAKWPVERVLAAKFLMAALTGFISWFVLGPQGLGRLLLVVVAGAAVGYFIPDLVVRSRATERQQEIERALPDVLDQLTMSVSAGLGFEAALGRAAQVGEGPMAEEVFRVLQEMQIGVSRDEALRNLAERSTVSDLRNFVFATLQSEAYGLPIADVLRVQASELRLKRHQRAEERALKIPVKIIFPLALCIFPALFIVLLGPAAIRIWRALGG